MPKGQRLKSEKNVTLLRQIDFLIDNGKSLSKACKEVVTGLNVDHRVILDSHSGVFTDYLE